MSPALARPLLHTAHLLTFVVLFASGLLLFVPGLRVAVTGGYSQVIRNTHRWGGVAFTVLPVLIIVRCGARTIFAPPPQRTLRTFWQGAHTGLTLLMCVAFVVTGVIIWAHRTVPDSVADMSHSAHDWLTYAAAVLVGTHLVEVGAAAVVARFRAAAATAVQRSKN